LHGWQTIPSEEFRKIDVEPGAREEWRITYGAPEPFAERVEDLKGRPSFFLVWPDEIGIMNRGKSGEIFCQKHPVKNRHDPFSPKAFCHKRSTRSANGSGVPLVILSGVPGVTH
jgi:choline dehydrogenase-like flavoprotein